MIKVKGDKNNSGFTLIELLIVIAIIGLITSIAVYNMNNSRIKSRDAKRLADLSQISKAVEFYYEDNEGYPSFDGGVWTPMSGDGDCGSGVGEGNDWCALETELSSYMTQLPQDPLGKHDDYVYYYRSNNSATGYALAARLEHSSNDELVTNDGGIYDDGVGGYYEIGTNCSGAICDALPD